MAHRCGDEFAGYTALRRPALPGMRARRRCSIFSCDIALLIGYYDSSYILDRDGYILSQSELQAMRSEPSFIHFADAPGTPARSRFAPLYKTESRITGSSSLMVSDYIRQQLSIASQTVDLCGADQRTGTADECIDSRTRAPVCGARRHLLVSLRMRGYWVS